MAKLWWAVRWNYEVGTGPVLQVYLYVMQQSASGIGSKAPLTKVTDRQFLNFRITF